MCRFQAHFSTRSQLHGQREQPSWSTSRHPQQISSLKYNKLTLANKFKDTSVHITFSVSIANHYKYIPSIKHQMDKDSLSDPSMKTRTHSQAPARKRNRKGSWGGLKPRVLARIHGISFGVRFCCSQCIVCFFTCTCELFNNNYINLLLKYLE